MIVVHFGCLLFCSGKLSRGERFKIIMEITKTSHHKNIPFIMLTPLNPTFI